MKNNSGETRSDSANGAGAHRQDIIGPGQDAHFLSRGSDGLRDLIDDSFDLATREAIVDESDSISATCGCGYSVVKRPDRNRRSNTEVGWRHEEVLGISDDEDEDDWREETQNAGPKPIPPQDDKQRLLDKRPCLPYEAHLVNAPTVAPQLVNL
jgi:hypothetical protein